MSENSLTLQYFCLRQPASEELAQLLENLRTHLECGQIFLAVEANPRGTSGDYVYKVSSPRSVQCAIESSANPISQGLTRYSLAWALKSPNIFATLVLHSVDHALASEVLERDGLLVQILTFSFENYCPSDLHLTKLTELIRPALAPFYGRLFGKGEGVNGLSGKWSILGGLPGLHQWNYFSDELSCQLPLEQLAKLRSLNVSEAVGGVVLSTPDPWKELSLEEYEALEKALPFAIFTPRQIPLSTTPVRMGPVQGFLSLFREVRKHRSQPRIFDADLMNQYGMKLEGKRR